jgi:hypothetical protein
VATWWQKFGVSSTLSEHRVVAIENDQGLHQAALFQMERCDCTDKVSSGGKRRSLLSSGLQPPATLSGAPHF